MYQRILRKFKHFLGRYDTPRGVVILMYHRVNDVLPDHPLVTRSKEFEKQMAFLNRHKNIYEVISLKDFEESPERFYNSAKPQTKIIITFDDGYQDNYLHAYPVLKKYKFSATVFLTAGLIDSDKKFKRYDAVQGRDMLNWEEIYEMLDNKITFGAHTVNHPHLSELSSQEQYQEISESIKEVKGHIPLEKQISTFCYPYGDYNEETLKVVQELSVKCALSVRVGFNTKDTPLHELKRIEVLGNDSIKSFEYKLMEKYCHG